MAHMVAVGIIRNARDIIQEKYLYQKNIIIDLIAQSATDGMTIKICPKAQKKPPMVFAKNVVLFPLMICLQ